MSKLFLITVLFLAPIASSFGQGKVAFRNDSLHLIYFDPNPWNMWAGDEAFAGQAVNPAATPGGITLVADLYAGTSANSLTFQKSTTLSASAGLLNGQNVSLSFSGGSTAYFQVQVHEAGYPTAADGYGYSYTGVSEVFTAQTSVGFAYYSIVQHSPSSLSTWTDGAYDLSSSAGAGS